MLSLLFQNMQERGCLLRIGAVCRLPGRGAFESFEGLNAVDSFFTGDMSHNVLLHFAPLWSHMRRLHTGSNRKTQTPSKHGMLITAVMIVSWQPRLRALCLLEQCFEEDSRKLRC